LIVPGLHGSEPQHWQSCWEHELPDAYRVIQADWSRPDRDAWLVRLTQEIERRPGAVLVGHSLGATLIAHLAALRPDLPVGGALLVAPADPAPLHTHFLGAPSFAPLPTARFAFPAIVVASRNDPHMPQIRAAHLAEQWGANFVDAGRSGHINVASGHGRWPEGWMLLRSLQTPPARSDMRERRSGVVVPLRARPHRNPAERAATP
jgi:predicted alpha/beta hydrolase family esterase